MKKILITGSSGSIASLARLAFSDHHLTLWSRQSFPLKENEVWLKSESLENSDWWMNVVLADKYDAILHLAEPLKKLLPEEDFFQIIKSHVNFLKRASTSASRVLYPSTAYKYDSYVSNKNIQYELIKKSTCQQVNFISNVYCPVIHPIIDHGHGLNLIKKKVDLIPIFNIFYGLDSTLPILDRKALLDHLRSFIDLGPVEIDWYSMQISISDLFSNPNKTNSLFISKIFQHFLTYFSSHPEINLIKHGRRLK